MAVKQYFNSNITQEWTNANTLFSDVTFTPDNNIFTHQIWVKNEGPDTINFSIRPTSIIENEATAQERNSWIKIAGTQEALTQATPGGTYGIGSILENEVASYFIQIEIPPTFIISPSAPNFFPIQTLDFETTVTSVSNTDNEFRINDAADFSYSQSDQSNPNRAQFETTRYSNGAITLLPNTTIGSWWRDYNMEEILPEHNPDKAEDDSTSFMPYLIQSLGFTRLRADSQQIARITLQRAATQEQLTSAENLGTDPSDMTPYRATIVRIGNPDFPDFTMTIRERTSSVTDYDYIRFRSDLGGTFHIRYRSDHIEINPAFNQTWLQTINRLRRNTNFNNNYEITYTGDPSLVTWNAESSNFDVTFNFEVLQEPAIPDNSDNMLPWLRINIDLQNLASTTPQPAVSEIVFIIRGERTVTRKYHSFLQYELIDPTIFGTLPNGIIAVNRDNEVIAVLNNVNEKFEFNYNRTGGNDGFSLTLRSNWDDIIGKSSRPIRYDDNILYIKDGKIWYRGVINNIRTKLGIKQSIEITGEGLAPQLKSIIVNEQFSEVGIQDVIIGLLNRYLDTRYNLNTEEKLPVIQYHRDNIENINATTSFHFKHKNLFDCITEIAGIAGANPTGEGSSGNDIIWGVNQEQQFYFKKKSTNLEYQFHVGKNISIDDPQVAPRFNKLILIGNTGGNTLSNFIPDGNFEATQGTADPNFTTYWRVDNNNEAIARLLRPPQVVTPIHAYDVDENIGRVPIGSRAFRISITNTANSDADPDLENQNYPDSLPFSCFRSRPFEIIKGETYRLSWYSRVENGGTPLKLFPTIYMLAGDVPLIRQDSWHRITNLNTTITLTQDWNRHTTAPFVIDHEDADDDDKTIFLTFPILQRRIRLTEDGEEDTANSDPILHDFMLIDGLYLYRDLAELPIPSPELADTKNGYTQTRIRYHEDGTQERITDGSTQGLIREYHSHVYTADDQYEMIIEDATAIENFNRVKETVKEYDSLNTYKESFNLAKTLLGDAANEAHRATVTVVNNNEAYQPYKDDEIHWGHARIFGSTNLRTQYEYAVISVKHTIQNNTLNTSLSLGAPRPDVPEVLRRLVARGNYKGESTGSSQTTAVSSSGSLGTTGGSGNPTVILSHDMPSESDIESALDATEDNNHPLWIVSRNQSLGATNEHNRGVTEEGDPIFIQSVRSEQHDYQGREISNSPVRANTVRMSAGTQVEIESQTQFNILSTPEQLIGIKTINGEEIETSPGIISIDQLESIRNIQSDWGEEDEEDPTFILNKDLANIIPLYVPGTRTPANQLRKFERGLYFSLSTDQGLETTPENSDKFTRLNDQVDAYTAQFFGTRDMPNEQSIQHAKESERPVYWILNTPQTTGLNRSNATFQAARPNTYDKDGRLIPHTSTVAASTLQLDAGTFVEIINETDFKIINTPNKVAGTYETESGNEVTVEEGLITNTEKEKLTGIEEGAEENVQVNWNEGDNQSDRYINNKPETITNTERNKLGGIEEGAEENVKSDWDEEDRNSDKYIENKPDIENLMAGDTGEGTTRGELIATSETLDADNTFGVFDNQWVLNDNAPEGFSIADNSYIRIPKLPHSNEAIGLWIVAEINGNERFARFLPWGEVTSIDAQRNQTSENREFLYVVSSTTDRVHVYDLITGEENTEKGFPLTPANSRPAGITWHQNRILVVDQTDDKVYSYSIDGTYVGDDDFDLTAGNSTPLGITAIPPSFEVVVADVDDTVYFYFDGEYDPPPTTFDQVSANSQTTGILYSNRTDTFYTVDDPDNRVYAYNITGDRDTSEEFNLTSSNTDPQGLAEGGLYLWVLDNADRAAYPYADDTKIYDPTRRITGLPSQSQGIVVILGTVTTGHVPDITEEDIFANRIPLGDTEEVSAYYIHATNSDQTELFLAGINTNIPSNATIKVYEAIAAAGSGGGSGGGGGGTGEANVQVDWEETNTRSDRYVRNKPPPGDVPLYVPGTVIPPSVLRHHDEGIYFSTEEYSGSAQSLSENESFFSLGGFNTIEHFSSIVSINETDTWYNTGGSIPAPTLANWVLISANEAFGDSYAEATLPKLVNTAQLRSIPTSTVGQTPTAGRRIQIESQPTLYYIGRTSSQALLLAANITGQAQFIIRRLRR